jgi:hypothetical protein
MISDRARYELYVLAEDSGKMGMAYINSFSGADKADSEIYFAAARAYSDMARGVPFADAVVQQDLGFRKYAAESARKIADAPKLTRGGYGGQSSLHYRYVDPGAFERHVLLNMKRSAERAMAMEGPSPQPLPGSRPAELPPPPPRAVEAPRALPKKGSLTAVSKERYRASPSEKRMYGGSTVTVFYVYRKEDAKNPSAWKVVRGYGPTPVERKTDAMNRSGL